MAGTTLKGPRRRVGDIRTTYGLSADDVAVAVDTDARTVRRWPAQAEARRSRFDDRIRALERVIEELEQLGLDRPSVRIWLREPNRYLHEVTPLAALGDGEFQAVIDAVRALAEGPVGRSTARPPRKR